MKPIAIRLAKILAGLVAAALVIHTILLVASGLALRHAREELRAVGRPMAIADIIPAPVPPSENAAPLYTSAFALLDSEAVGEDSLRTLLSRAGREYGADPESAEKREAFERLLANETTVQALKLIEQAAARPRCNFDLPYAQGTTLIIPHVNGMIDVGIILQARMALEMRRGDAEAAWRDLETTLRMADALRDEPVLISALVRVAMFRMALASVTMMSNLTLPNDAAAARLSMLAAPADDIAPFIRAMDGERLIYGEAPFNLNFMQNALESLPSPSEKHSGLTRWVLLRFSYRPLLQANYADYLRGAGKEVADAAHPFWENPSFENTQVITAKDFLLPNMSKLFLLPALTRIRPVMANLQANARVVQTGLALLRHKIAHGAYPPTLAEVDPSFLAEIPLDPFTGQPLVYRPEGDGFVLYSLGENLRDDDGTEEAKNNKKSKAFDIVWRASR